MNKWNLNAVHAEDAKGTNRDAEVFICALCGLTIPPFA
jgi:hypothetical protein